jgi:YD repeat-containing protein
MKPIHLHERYPTCLRHSFTLLTTLAGAALLIGISTSRILADPGGLPPTIQFTQGLLGKQVCLQWDAQPGVQYLVQKSTALGAQGSPGGFAQVALVTAEGATCQWVEPEAATTKGFYRIEIPGAQVFALEPPTIAPTGGDIFVRGQCLPTGSFLVLEIPGQAPVSVPLEPVAGQPGLWKASISSGGIIGIAIGSVIGTRVVDTNGTTVALVDQTLEVTETGYAADAPPWLPPGVPDALSNPIPGIGIVVKKNKPKKSSHRVIGGESGDDEAGDGEASAVIAAWLSRKGYQYYMAKSDLNSAGLQNNPTFQENSNQGTMPDARTAGAMNPYFISSENSGAMVGEMRAGSGTGKGKVSMQDFHFSAVRSLPGEVSSGQCDLALACPAGPPLAWVRSYRSKKPFAGNSAHSTGGCWHSSYDISIEPVPLAAGVNAPVLLVHDGSGRTDKFVRQGDGTYRCNGMFREGRFNPDSSFTLTFADKGTWIFCPLVGAPWAGRIGSITDRNGVALGFTYTAGGKLNTVTSQFGQSLTCAYGPTGQLTSITDHTGRFVAYDYYSTGEPGGSPGDLKSVSCVQLTGQPPLTGPTTYTYSTGHTDDQLNHNLLTITDGASRLVEEYTYSAQTDPLAIDYDVVATVDANRSDALSGHVTVLKMFTLPPSSGAAYRCTVNDELGRVTEYDFDKQHRCLAMRELTGFSEPDGAVTATENRPTGKLRPSDPEAYVTAFRYNADNSLTRVTYADGSQELHTYGREFRRDCPVRERGNEYVTTLRAPGGEERTVTCDYLPGFGTNEMAGLWKEKKRPGRESPTLASLARAVPGGHGIWAGEDGDGGCTELARGVDRDGKDCTDPRRPKLGHARMIGEGPGVWAGEDGEGGCTDSAAKAGKTKHKGWDGLIYGSHRTRLTTSHGQIFTWSHDENGNCTSARTPVAGSGCDIAYNTLGQCTGVTVLNGGGAGFVSQFTYDAATHWPLSQIEDPAGLNLTTTCERDSLGRVTRCVDPRGNDWLTEYDALDRVTVSRTPAVGTGTPARIATNYFYDASGLLARCDIEHRDATGALDAANPAYSAFIVYDNRGRLTRITDEQRPVSPPATVLDPGTLGDENFAVCDFTYDDAGQCVRVATPAASRGQALPAVCDFDYDERGLLYRVTHGGRGNTISTTQQLDYDALGACVTKSLLPSPGAPALEAITSTFSYDGFHRLASSTDPMGNQTFYAYDAQGFVTISSMGEVNDVPGSAGNVLLAEMKTNSDKITAKLAKESHGCRLPAGAFFDVFVADDVWVIARFAPGTAGVVATETQTIHRSPAGLAMSMTNNADTLLTCSYDSAGRLAACSDGACTIALTRDAEGRMLVCGNTDHFRIAGTPDKTFTRSFSYDALGRCVSALDGGTNSQSYEFDSLGRSTQLTDARGVVYRYRYDGEITGTSGTPEPFSTVCEVDVDGDGSFEMLSRDHCWSGECRSVTDANGYATLYDRDALGRLVRTAFPDGTQELRAFDAYGRHNSRTHRDGTVSVADLDRDGYPDVVTCTGTAGAVPVPDTTYVHDGLGRVVLCVQGTSSLSFTWDSMGNPLSETHNGVTVSRTFDQRGRTSVTYGDGTRFAESRDALGLLLSKSAVTGTGALVSPPVTVVEYAGHRPWRETRANGVVTTFEYRADADTAQPGGDDFSFDKCVREQTINPGGTVLSSTVFRRNRNQALSERETVFGSGTHPPGRRNGYFLDRLDRLTRCLTRVREVAGGPLTTETDVTYTLDLEGRRLTATGGPNPGSYVQEATTPPADHQMGQYSSWPGGPLTWDDQGSLTSMSSSAGQKQFIYDAASRLVAVNNAATGTPIAAYTYDAAGRRTSSTIAASVQGAEPVTTSFSYDGAVCIQELGSDGLPNLTFATAEAGGIHLCIVSRNGTLVYPHGGSADDNCYKKPRKKKEKDPWWKAFPYRPLPLVPMGKLTELPETELPEPHFPDRGGDDGCDDDCGGPIIDGGAGPGILTGLAGAVVECTDTDHAGAPIFLTGEGVVRATATGTLSGYDWFGGDRYCPETGFLQAHGVVHSPQLGQPVSMHKKKPKTKDPAVTPKPYVKSTHVSLLK